MVILLEFGLGLEAWIALHGWLFCAYGIIYPNEYEYEHEYEYDYGYEYEWRRFWVGFC